MSELLPCPFCGGKFKMSQEPNDNGYVAGMYYIYHEHGPVGSNARECIIDIRRHFDSEDDAISAWNTRATTPTASELVEANQRMKAALEQIASLRWKNVTFPGNPDPADIARAALSNIGGADQ